MKFKLATSVAIFALAFAQAQANEGLTGDNTATVKQQGVIAKAPISSSKPIATVNWQKWNDQIFEQAKKENKLVILDLEAVWCHWCHVMEHKTYNNPEVIQVLQKHFISVKVDQDARPDLANRYQDYGWPATVIFSSHGEELAKRQGFIYPGEMVELLSKLALNPVPEDKNATAELKYSSEAALSKILREELSNNQRRFYDDKLGGWQTSQKFLDADTIEYAMTLAKEGDARESKMAKQTLDAQLKLFDPIWGGVYQYSTNEDWKHPHFEKIMSVQSDNMRAYALASLLFKNPHYLSEAEGIEKYLRTFLQSPDGAFYTSQDADLKQGEHSAEYFKLSDAARRAQGVPRVDKHIYSRENGWAISGLVAIYEASDQQKYLDEAEKAAAYILKNRRMDGGGFHHDANDVSGPFLGDSLYMGRALLDLYQATGDRKWLKEAEACASFIDAHFKNKQHKAGYLTASPEHSAFHKSEPLLDENVELARFANMIYQYTAKAEFKSMAESCMHYIATPEIAHAHKVLVSGILLADRELSNPPAHVTIVGSKSDATARKLFEAANRYPLAYKRVEWFDRKEGKMPNPDTEYPDMPKAAAFACANNRCSRPVYKPEEINELIDRTSNSKH